MDLMKLFREQMAEQIEQEKNREAEEQAQMQKEADYYTDCIKKAFEEKKFVCHDWGEPVIAMTIGTADMDHVKLMEKFLDSGLESYIIEKLEKDDIGPIKSIALQQVGIKPFEECVSLDSEYIYFKGPKNCFNVECALIDYGKETE